ncbi:hypothetical protein ACIRYZ_41770 [Kitasatospora sp. NPDC101155]|uniref:hypothetical protein n=1 Tax=Kitasatospora sp. NPDC101155 TaxID=3364097 RepID=UPI00381118A0
MSRRSSIATLTLSLAVAVTLSGCSAVSSVTNPTSAASTTATASATAPASASTAASATAKADLFTAPAIDQALQALAKKVGASPMKVLKIDVFPDFVSVEAADPAKPTEVNKFTYRDGGVMEPQPVKLSTTGSDDPGAVLKENLFDSTEVKPEALAKVLAGAAAASKVEGGKAGGAIIQRNLPFSSTIQIIVNVDGTRANKQVRATLDGKITEIV